MTDDSSYPTIIKWWLISDEDVQTIRDGLTYKDPMLREDALHALDSGLHITECVPEDFKEGE